MNVYQQFSSREPIYWPDSIFKFAQQQQTIQGPAVDSLIQTIHMMYGRGAPTEYDDTGFNKIHYTYPLFRRIEAMQPGQAMSVADAIQAINALVIYSKRQIPQYLQLKAGISALVQSTMPQTSSQFSQPEAGDLTVKLVGKDKWGNSEFFIPKKIENNKEIDFTRKVNAAVRDVMAALSEKGETKYQQSVNSFGGISYPVFKGFSKSKTALDQYVINPQFIPIVSQTLSSLGYNVSEMSVTEQNIPSVNTTPVTNTTNDKNPQVNQTNKKQLKEIKLEGNRLTINIGSFVAEAINLIKSLPSMRAVNNPQVEQYREYDPNGYVWFITNPQITIVDQLISIFSKNGFDVSKLEAIKNQLEQNPQNPQNNTEQAPQPGKPEQTAQPAQLIKFTMRDVTGETGNKWHVAVKFLSKGSFEGESLKEIMRYSFLNFSKTLDDPEGNRAYANYECYLKGDYRDYIDFYTSLRNRGFDITQLRDIIKSLIAKGLVKPTRKPGDVDGYANVEEFNKTVKTYEANTGFPLYKEQQEGIAYLYSHESGYLGDDVGVGKTLQTVIAADLRAKQNGGRSIIVTKKNVKDQFIEQIKKITKIKDEEISDNPLAKTRWTVLHYNVFSTPTQREGITKALVDQAKAGEISCLVLDECQSVKNGTPTSRDETGNMKHKSNHTTFNIQEFSQYIPFVWGASATIVANKPVDVYNQLRAINHKLGKMPWNSFKKEFGGYVDGKEGTFEQQFEAVSRLKQALVDQRAYIQRSKKDIRADMPDQNITFEEANIDQKKLYTNVGNRLSAYKNPELPVSAMIAFRTEAAIGKAPVSVEMASKVLAQGKKVAIFTDCNESKDIIVSSLQKILGNTGRVVVIAGGMTDKQRKESVRVFKDPNSDARAMVLNIIAGGTGLDFPNVLTDVINNDFDWSVGMDDQALGRFYRINSNENINVRYVVAKNSPDEIYYEKMSQKKKIAEVVRKLTQEQMNLLLSGHRRGKSEKLQEIEKNLREAEKQQMILDEQEGMFQAQIAEQIRNKINGTDEEEIIANNWYSRIKIGFKK